MSGFTGSVSFDVGFPGVQGVPGSPFGFVLHHDSSRDDGETTGDLVNVDIFWRFTNDEDYAGRATAIRGLALQARTSAGDGYDDDACPVRRRAFGEDAALLLEACNAYRGPGPLSISARNTYSRSRFTENDYLCLHQDIGSHDGPAFPTWRGLSLGVPFTTGAGAMSTWPAGCNCVNPPADDMGVGGLYAMRVRVTAEYADWGSQVKDYHCGDARPDPTPQANHTKELLAWLEPSNDTTVDWLGRNWTHAYADTITEHVIPNLPNRVAGGPEDQRFAVLHTYRGDHVILKRPDPPVAGFPRQCLRQQADLRVNELHPQNPNFNYCRTCRPWQLYEGAASEEAAYVQLFPDGSRRLFKRYGGSGGEGGKLRLWKILDRGNHDFTNQEWHDFNATVLTWSNVPEGAPTQVLALTKVTDAAGNEHVFDYVAGPSPGEPLRLRSVTFPDGRQVRLTHEPLYGRLTAIEDGDATTTHAAWGVTYVETDPSQRYSVASKVSPDGETATYTYRPAGTTNGRWGWIATATVGNRTWTYTYGDPTAGERWMKATPADPLSAPAQYFAYDGTGKTTRSATIPWDCTDPPLCEGAVITDVKRDGLDRVVAITRSTVVSGEAKPAAKQCVEYRQVAKAGGTTNLHYAALPYRVWGPLCHQGESRQEGDDVWDCEIGNRDACDPVTELEWEWLEAMSTGAATQDAAWYRLKSITPGSATAATPPDRPRVRFFYDDLAPLTSASRNTLEKICTATDAPSGTDWNDPTQCDVPQVFGWDPSTRQLTSITDGAGATWTLGYDPTTHLLTSVTAPDPGPSSGASQLVTTLGYHPTRPGLVTSVTAPGGLVTRYDHDWRGAVTTIARPSEPGGESSTEITYTPGGKVQQITDLNRGTSWLLEYHPLTDLAALGSSAMTGLPARVSRLYPNALKRPGDPRTADPIKDVYQTWLWNANEQLAYTRLRSGRWLAHEYEEHGFLQRRFEVNGTAWPPAPASNPGVAECWEYDEALATPTRVAFKVPWTPSTTTTTCPWPAPDALEEFVHDTEGKLLESSLSWTPGPDTLRILRFHDTEGRLQGLRTRSGGSAPIDISENTYAFDLDGRMTTHRLFRTSALDPGSIVAEYAYTFDEAGRVASVMLGNGVEYTHVDDYTYFPDGRLATASQSPLPNPAILSRVDALSYDAAGRIGGFSHTADAPLVDGMRHAFSYEYDADSEVRRAIAIRETILDPPPFPPAPNPQETLYDLEYGYDRSFNLSSITDHLGGTTTTFQFDGNDRLYPDTQFAFDAGGNMVWDGERVYTFDMLDRLTSVETPSFQEIAQYAYDPFARMIASQTAGESRTWRAWSGWTLDAERTQGPVLTADRKYGHAGSLTADGHVKPGEPFSDYDVNAQGSRVSWSGTDYNPIYDPFGRAVGTDLPSDSPIGFQGQEWRAEAGAYYMRHRWYDPDTTRFASPDPLLSTAVNNYDFGLNDPVRRRDPLGLTPDAASLGMHRLVVTLTWRALLGEATTRRCGVTFRRSPAFMFMTNAFNGTIGRDGVIAITPLPHTVFYADDLSVPLMNHELAHSGQHHYSNGWFLPAYVLANIADGGYGNNRFEDEANRWEYLWGGTECPCPNRHGADD